MQIGIFEQWPALDVPCASVRHDARHALAGCSDWGVVFLADVLPGSPSRIDTFLLLRVAARLSRGGRVGPYVVRWAWSPTIRASFLAAATKQYLIEMLARGGRRHHEPHYGAAWF